MSVPLSLSLFPSITPFSHFTHVLVTKGFGRVLSQDTYWCHTVSVFHCVQPEPYWRKRLYYRTAVVPYTPDPSQPDRNATANEILPQPVYHNGNGLEHSNEAPKDALEPSTLASH